MGYDLHITRADNWFESDEKPISLTEWKDIINKDQSLRMDGVAETVLPDGTTMRYENDGLTIWLSGTDDEHYYFDFRNGEIVLKNPDDYVIEKMKELAIKLNARVIGDDGEEY